MSILSSFFSDETNPIIKNIVYFLIATQILALVVWILLNIKYAVEAKKEALVKEKLGTNSANESETKAKKVE